MKNINPKEKYLSAPVAPSFNRTWPDNTLEKAPIWCSVDLRDGNQALTDPMNYKQKMQFFDLLVDIGFKDIEIGFPSASDVEFQFARGLIDNNKIPDDVKPQVLVQAREHLIKRTFEALDGYKNAIVHLYNSTSISQRKIVFKKDREGIKKLAVDAAKLIKKMSADVSTNLQFEYSPESFSGTEPEFALDICLAVAEILEPTIEKKLILNLPATVELTTPNIHADSIEWFIQNLPNRERFIVSIHTHNDRGTGVAATELALLAGGDRVEGTLFGNGERTGNVDLVTVAMNLYLQGIHPGLDLSNLNEIAEVYKDCTNQIIHPRHPYIGELVFTAFSGSHQDAIKKGMDFRKASNSKVWDVPYIPIDPKDIGQTYEAVVRINSQSGKGGVAFILDSDWGIPLPKSMHMDFAKCVQEVSEKTGAEVSSKDIYEIFKSEYLENLSPLELVDFNTDYSSDIDVSIEANLIFKGKKTKFNGTGNGPINALGNALRSIVGFEKINITHFSQEAMASGDSSKAISFVQVTNGKNKAYGVGIHPSIVRSSLQAFISALNRL